jgi:hypothetical protein
MAHPKCSLKFPFPLCNMSQDLSLGLTDEDIRPLFDGAETPSNNNTFSSNGRILAPFVHACISCTYSHASSSGTSLSVGTCATHALEWLKRHHSMRVQELYGAHHNTTETGTEEQLDIASWSRAACLHSTHTTEVFCQDKALRASCLYYQFLGRNSYSSPELRRRGRGIYIGARRALASLTGRQLYDDLL